MSETTSANYTLGVRSRPRSSTGGAALGVSPLEQITQQQIAQVDGSQLLGYHNNARTRAESMAEAANAASMAESAGRIREAELEAAARVADARNPEMAAYLLPLQRMLDPRFRDITDRLPGVLEARQVSEVNFNNARANQANTEAGIMPPQGSQTDRYSLPLEPRSQGTPLDLREAALRAASGGSGGAGRITLQALTGVANGFANRETQIATAANAAEGRMLSGLGVTYDSRGQMVVPPNVTQEQIQAVRARARAEAEQAVDRATADARAIYERGGYGHLLPPPQPRNEPSMPPPVVPQPARPGTGPVVPPNVAPRTAAPAQQQRPAPSAVSPAQQQRFDSIAPPQPGTRRFLQGNEIVYVNQQGVITRRVPVQ